MVYLFNLQQSKLVLRTYELLHNRNFLYHVCAFRYFFKTMTDYELKGHLIEQLKYEIKKPLNEQHPWLNAIYLVPEIAVFIYNDFPIKYEIVKYLIDKKFLIYKDTIKHQGELMYRYVLNTER